MVGRPSVRSATMSPFGSTFMLTGIVIKSDPHGPYKLSPVMQLFVDGEPRTATFRLREAQSTLSWKVKPAVAITAKSIISIQPYEAHGRDRRRKAEAVNVQGDAILRFCSSRPGDKHDFERAYVGFSVLLSIATQEDSKARDKVRGREDRAASPGGNGPEIFFSPATAPNSFKRSLDSLHGLMELIPPYSGLYETARETRDALKSACYLMPVDHADADVQSLGEQVHDLLVEMQLPKFAERLISQTWTVTYILNLVRNAALFAEDCAKREFKELGVVDYRMNILVDFDRQLTNLKRNFTAGKETHSWRRPYTRPEFPTLPVPPHALSGGPRSIPSPYDSAVTGSSLNLPVQTRAIRVSQKLRPHARSPRIMQDADEQDLTRRDWRSDPSFRPSRCTGTRKALCVGINYTGQRNALRGCVNDVRNVHQFLLEHSYRHSNIIILTDDNPSPRSQPTRTNLLNAMRWLVEGARPDDALFLHYSGHGGSVPDLDGDEADGRDEVIYPLDWRTTGIITDDLLHATLVKPLPAGCRLTAVFDSCHSGSMLDLVFEFHSNGKVKSSPVSPPFHREKSSPADIICFSGCKDSQASADVVKEGLSVGAMSHAFLTVLKRNPQVSYIDLLRGVREILRKKYGQKPQLSSTHPLGAKLHFVV